jgi:uncharacterized protein (TIGR02145 family)
MTFLRIVLFILLITGSLIDLKAQNITITDDAGYEADSSAMLDVKSTTKGMLVPRMTTLQREAVNNPATGLLVFDTDAGGFFFFNGTEWADLSGGGDVWQKTNNKVALMDSTDNVGVGTNEPSNKLTVKGDPTDNIDESIFAVVNADGDTLFAVYPEGTRVFVKDNAGAKSTGNRGGFAVGGFTTVKGDEDEYLRVTSDSVRVYIKDEPSIKATGSRGGFAVGGFTTVKAGSDSTFYFFADEIGTQVTFLTGDQRDAIAEPEEGSIIFNTTDSCIQVYLGIWESIWCTSLNCIAPMVISNPLDQTSSVGGNLYFVASAEGTRLNSHWQVSSDEGETWAGVSDVGVYSGSATDTLWMNSIPYSYDGNLYRRIFINTCGDAITQEAKLTVWSCGYPYKDGRDGTSYGTKSINGKCWLKENMNIGIIVNSNTDLLDNDTIEKYCYENNESNCDAYGGLYTWYEMMQYAVSDGGGTGSTQGICPEGWHLPTEYEWDNLVSAYGGDAVAGGPLKETGTSHWSSPNSGATNSSGFTGLPGGNKNTGTTFSGINDFGYYWTSTQYSSDTDQAHRWYLRYNSGNAFKFQYSKGYCYSVRCIKN